MLRHLGPVSPVSGLRHETSWPELSEQENKPKMYTKWRKKEEKKKKKKTHQIEESIRKAHNQFCSSLLINTEP